MKMRACTFMLLWACAGAPKARPQASAPLIPRIVSAPVVAEPLAEAAPVPLPLPTPTEAAQERPPEAAVVNLGGCGEGLVISAGPCLRVVPAQPRPGELVMFEVLGAAEATGVTLAVWGHEVRLFRVGARFRGFVGVPIGAQPVGYETRVTVHLPAAAAAFLCGETRVAARAYNYDELRVAKRYAHARRPMNVQGGGDEGYSVGITPRDQPVSPSALFLWPKSGHVNAYFGSYRLFNRSLSGRHFGLDIDGEVGDRVFASQGGVVRFSARHGASGETVVIDHGGGILTHYLHLSKRLVRAGDRVKPGELVGLVGKTGRVTGAHLHFAVSVHGRYVDPEQVLSHPMYAKQPGSVCVAN